MLVPSRLGAARGRKMSSRSVCSSSFQKKHHPTRQNIMFVRLTKTCKRQIGEKQMLIREKQMLMVCCVKSKRTQYRITRAQTEAAIVSCHTCQRVKDGWTCRHAKNCAGILSALNRPRRLCLSLRERTRILLDVLQLEISYN